MTLAFDNVPHIYTRVRPEYPPTLYDALFEMLPDRGEPVRAIEVGAGTGQATGPLLARGAHVTAVEIGPSIAAYLEQRFSRQPNLTVITSPFEDAPLAEGAWDLVLSATAYHWVRPDARMTRPHALLAPGGVLAVIDTIQVASDADRGYFKRSHPIYQKYWPQQQYQDSPDPDVDPPILEEMRASGLFEDVQVRRQRWDQIYPVDRYMELVESYSNTNLLPPEKRARFLADLRAFIEQEPGASVLRPLSITMVTGRRAG